MTKTKTTTMILAVAALSTGAHAATLADSASKLTSTTANAGKKVVGGAADFGKGLLSAPKSLVGNLTTTEAPNLSVGTQEFGISGNVDLSSSTVYNLNLSYGYFFKDNWQVGFVANVSGENSDANFGAGIFTEYNFVSQSSWVPFVGASLSVIGADGDATGGVALDFGVKYFIRSNVAVTFGLGGEFSFEDLPGKDDLFSPNINIGTRFYF